MRSHSRAGSVAAFLHSFLIQGSWNYRTMIGGGFAFAMAPVLRRLYRGDPEGLERALRRHAQRFNAHPYMTGIALGACVRLEEEGATPEVVERFKTALGGSLGGLGDRLAWAAWLPSCVLVGLVAALVGAHPAVGVLLFLILYNAGHIWLRVWSFQAGLAEGKGVGRLVATLGIPRVSERITLVGVLLLGVVCGLLLARGIAPVRGSWLWTGAAALAFLVGSWAGQRAWRPALRGTALVLAVVFVVGSVIGNP